MSRTKSKPLFLLAGALAILAPFVPVSYASDWDEDSPKAKPKTGSNISDSNKSAAPPLEGKVEKMGEASTRIQRQQPGDLKAMPLPDNAANGLEGKAVDDELRGMLKDGQLNQMNPNFDRTEPLRGFAELAGGKGAKTVDPDGDDAELMVEWDRWRNRFLRAVQLGAQEILNNPDPEDFVRPRVDPRTGMITSAFGMGTSCAFSCQITSDGQIRNLEIISASGNAKYDRAVLRAVQQLAGTQILRFPKGSHRLAVSQPGRITTSNSNQFQYHHFGDVERVRN